MNQAIFKVSSTLSLSGSNKTPSSLYIHTLPYVSIFSWNHAPTLCKWYAFACEYGIYTHTQSSNGRHLQRYNNIDNRQVVGYSQSSWKELLYVIWYIIHATQFISDYSCLTKVSKQYPPTISTHISISPNPNYKLTIISPRTHLFRIKKGTGVLNHHQNQNIWQITTRTHRIRKDLDKNENHFLPIKDRMFNMLEIK